jgi:LacI family transcriptional regulator
MAKRITQDDVAKAAGVSRFTVSSVINNRSGGNVRISDETRQRVLKTVAELGYFPDRTARSLRMSKTNTLAAIIPDITNPYYPTFVRGIQDIAESCGFELIIYNTDGNIEKEKKCLLSIRQNRVDGLIAVLFHLTADHLAELNIPVVHLQLKPSQPPPVDVVYIDNFAASCSVINYLIERGYNTIGMLAGIEDTPPRLSRILGYSQALSEHHIPLQENLIRGGDYTEAGGYQGMQELLNLPARPRAVFAANDLMAMGAMIAIREAGLHIPEDIAIAGFDDISAARLVNPPLTTVTQFQDQIGQRATQMLLERINGLAPQEMCVVEMPHQLIIRQST